MLRMVMAKKAISKLQDITATRGSIDNVKALQRELKKQIEEADRKPGEVEPVKDWNETIAQLAGKLGDTVTARKAKLRSKGLKILAAQQEG